MSVSSREEERKKCHEKLEETHENLQRVSKTTKCHLAGKFKEVRKEP